MLHTPLFYESNCSQLQVKNDGGKNPFGQLVAMSGWQKCCNCSARKMREMGRICISLCIIFCNLCLSLCISSPEAELVEYCQFTTHNLETKSIVLNL